MKFLLDENVHAGLLPFLKGLGHDAIGCPKSIRNGEVFRLALNEERILITRDTDFLAGHFTGLKHSGIILLRVPARDIEAQKTAFSGLFKAHPSANDFMGKIVGINPDSSFAFGAFPKK